MAKVATSVTVFQTAAGLRMSTTYCEIEGGTITRDNIRVNRILSGEEVTKGTDLLALAQSYLEEE